MSHTQEETEAYLARQDHPPEIFRGTFLSPPTSWQTSAFTSEGPGRGLWCLSILGSQIVIFKLSASKITSLTPVQSCTIKFFIYIYLADCNSTWSHKESRSLSARWHPVLAPCFSGDLKCLCPSLWALSCVKSKAQTCQVLYRVDFCAHTPMRWCQGGWVWVQVRLLEKCVAG